MRDDSTPTADVIFCDALERPPEERASFVHEACCGNASLEKEVHSLLAAHPEAQAFLAESLMSDTIRGLGVDGTDPLIGATLGAYRILECISTGGMGAVYVAERDDAEFEKRVAIKVIKRGLDTDDILRRFRTERQVLANLEHPNIARLLDGGATPGGSPYLVMEFIEGVRIDTYCDEARQTIEKRLELFISLCGAVQYAHQHLVVHRDLKPANILVAETGQVKLLDFGIAKVLAPSDAPARDITSTAERQLTPAYASPEQLRGQATTTASDVYSLGVILYELLTGRHPFRSGLETAAELERKVCEEPPTSPSTAWQTDAASTVDAPDVAGICAARVTDPARLRRQLRGDLENIILMAMRKEPDRRYASVEQLANDIRAYQAGLPVSAQPDSLGYRTSKFIRRNRIGVAAAVLILISLVGGLTVSLMMYASSEAARLREKAALVRAEETSRFLRSLLASIHPAIARGRDVTILREVLDDAAVRIETELQNLPLVAQSIHTTIGQTYNAIAEYDEAERHLRAAIAIGDAMPDSDGDVMTEAIAALGNLLYNTGRYDKATTALEKALSRQRAAAPDDLNTIGFTLRLMAEILQAQGEYDASLETYEESIATLRRADGESEAALAGALRVYASALADKERHDAALVAMTESLAIQETLVDDNHPDLAAAHLTMGWVLRRSGDPVSSERHYRTSLEIARRVYPEDHPEVAMTMNHLAGTLEDLEKFDGVEEMFQQALAIFEKNYGESHRAVGTAHNNLAVLYRKLKRHEEAEVHFRKALEIYEATLGRDHVFVAIVETSFIAMLEEQGRLLDAEPFIEHSRELTQRYWSTGYVLHDYIRGAVAALQMERGDPKAAESILLETYQALEAARGRQFTMTRLALQRLTRLYELLNNEAEVARYQVLLDEAAPDTKPTPSSSDGTQD